MCESHYLGPVGNAAGDPPPSREPSKLLSSDSISTYLLLPSVCARLSLTGNMLRRFRWRRSFARLRLLLPRQSRLSWSRPPDELRPPGGDGAALSSPAPAGAVLCRTSTRPGQVGFAAAMFAAAMRQPGRRGGGPEKRCGRGQVSYRLEEERVFASAVALERDTIQQLAGVPRAAVMVPLSQLLRMFAKAGAVDPAEKHGSTSSKMYSIALVTSLEEVVGGHSVRRQRKQRSFSEQ